MTTTKEHLQYEDNFKELLTQQLAEASQTLQKLQADYEEIYKKKAMPITNTHAKSAKEFSSKLGPWRKARSQFITATMLLAMWDQDKTIEARQQDVRPLLAAAEDVRMHQGRSAGDLQDEVNKTASSFYNAAVADFDELCPHFNALVKAVNKNDGEAQPSRRDATKLVTAFLMGGFIAGQGSKYLVPTEDVEQRRQRYMGSFMLGGAALAGAYDLANRPKLPQNRREFEELSNSLSVVYQNIEKKELDRERTDAKKIELRLADYFGDLPEHFDGVAATLQGQDKEVWEQFNSEMRKAFDAQPKVSEDEPLGHYARIARAYEAQHAILAAVYSHYSDVEQLVMRHTQPHAAPGKLNQASSETCLTILGRLKECSNELMIAQEDIISRAENMAIYAHQPNIGVTR